MNHTLIVESIQSSDRNIVLFFEGRNLVGLNFWQGANDMTLFEYYKTSDTVLFKFVKRHFEQFHFVDTQGMCNIHGSEDYFEMIDLIDAIIWNYLNIYMQIDELEIQIKNLKKLL
jgi:hypothetical protein